MKKMSVKLKITLWYTLTMLIVSAVVLAAMTTISVKLLNRDTIASLNRAVNDMTREIEISPDARKIPEFKYFDRGVHMTLYDENQNVAGSQIPFGITDELKLDDGGVRRENYNGRAYYVLDKTAMSRSGKVYWVKGLVLVSDSAYAIHSVAKYNIALAAVMIIIAAAGGYIIVRKTLKPVDKIRRTADEISRSSDLSGRINMSGGDDEFQRLADSFDRMLDKIEQTLEREKQFTSDASHELRTPVAAMLSAYEYMTAYAKTYDEMKESAESVKAEAERMSKLISELLTISRMDKNTIKTKFERVDISELLGFVCDEQDEIRDEKLCRKIEENVTADADRFLIARLAINLISNAYTYGGKNVTVSLRCESGNIVLGVEDDGIGISKEDIPKIWTRFYQADPSRSAEGNMGLGLSMVLWIAECHGGKMEVESEPGKGSKFTFTMPVKSE